MTERHIFHIARVTDWEQAHDEGVYRVSTLGRTLDDEGFIHCSASADQGAAVLTNFYARVDEALVVLTVSTGRVPHEIVDEVPDGATEAFPHIYGPLPVDAVVAVTPVPRSEGAPIWPDLGAPR